MGGSDNSDFNLMPAESRGKGGETADLLPRLAYLPITDLSPDPANPRKHSRAQIRGIARSIESFGFNAPILINKKRRIIAGHGRCEAAKLLGLSQVPVICLEHLTDAQARAYMLADNKLTDSSSWDDKKLAVHLKELSELVLDFEIEATGFEPPEIDFRIQSLDAPEASDAADEFQVKKGPATSILGDVWLLGNNRLYCGSALDPTVYAALLREETAAAIFADPPYNLKIDGHVCGTGAIKHREFPMASGEMTEDEFIRFLTNTLELTTSHTSPGALMYICMDWRHMGQMLAAGRASGCTHLNLCVWVKPNGGMGSLYRLYRTRFFGHKF
jgi:ParB-like nuclease domain